MQGHPDPVTVLRGHAGEVQTLDVDPSERWLVSGDSTGEVRVWDLLDRRPVAIRRLHPVNAGVINLRLFQAGGGQRLLVTQGRDGVTHLWSCQGEAPVPSEEPVCTFAREAYHFCRFSLLPLPPESAAGSGSPPPAVHSCSGGAAPPLLSEPLLLAVPGSDAGAAEVWCCACRQLVARFTPEAAGKKLGMVMSLSLYRLPPCASDAGEGRGGAEGGGGADGSGRVFLAAGYEEGSLVVWDVAAPEGSPPLAQRRLFTEPLMALALDPHPASGVCGAAESKLTCFATDHAAGKIRVSHSVDLRKEGIADLAVRPDGRLLASAGWDGRVRLYKRSSGRPLAVLKYHKAAATVVRFSERSLFLASGARDGAIALWAVYQPQPGAAQALPLQLLGPGQSAPAP